MQVVPKLSATSQQSWMRREKLNAKNSTYFGQLFKSACKPKGLQHEGLQGAVVLECRGQHFGKFELRLSLGLPPAGPSPCACSAATCKDAIDSKSNCT